MVLVILRFSTNTYVVVTSKQEAEKAMAESNHGDEAKKHTFQLDRTKGRATNCTVATAQMSL